MDNDKSNDEKTNYWGVPYYSHPLWYTDSAFKKFCAEIPFLELIKNLNDKMEYEFPEPTNINNN
jgi:hypothetical protein